MAAYPNLFRKGKLGRITTKNRIVMSPMGDEMANADGSVSEQAIAYFTERAKGGAGVIIPGVFCVDYPTGKTVASQTRLDGIKYIKNLERLARSVHRYGALLIPQLHHAGMSTDKDTTEGFEPVRVSTEERQESEERTVIGSKPDNKFIAEKVLTIEEIKELEQKFIKAAGYAQMAGCDGIDLHGGGGYLISQFLTPTVNKRTDEYGGSLENRIRFAVNIIRGIREKCGPDFIVGIRMPVHMYSSDGFTDEESKAMAKSFEAAGADFIDTMYGFTPKLSIALETQNYPQGARMDLARKIVGEVKVPVFSNGNFKEPGFCEKVLANGFADFIALGRPLLADPYWPNKAKAGKADEIRKCISCCDGCAGALMTNTSIRCILNPEVGYEFELKNENVKTTPKRVVVVGGGIGGMQAAITATKRGHNVTLLEKTDKLGGQLHLASVPPHKEIINWATDWFTGEIKRSNINVEYSCDADVDYVKSLNPDAVIIATGATPITPRIPGVERGVQSWDILSGAKKAPENQKVTVIGGGVVGCETALLLKEKGNKVTILEMLPDYAAGLYILCKMDMTDEFKEKGIVLETQAFVKEIKLKKVEYEKNGVLHNLDSDFVVLAAGQQSYGQELAGQLEDAGIDVTTIGDAKKPAKIANATREGFFAALNL